MGTWNRFEIKHAYDEGTTKGASHMLVAWDSFDGENYAIYVMPGDNPRSKMPTNGDSVDECYNYSLGWAAQSRETRARHFEYDEIIPFVDASGLVLKAETRFNTGIELPFKIPARSSEIFSTPEKSGTVFISIDELDSLSDTETFNSYILLSSEAEQALIDAGWASIQTRGGVVATEKFKKSDVMSTLINRASIVWEEQREQKVLSILETLTEDERSEMKELLDDGE